MHEIDVAAVSDIPEAEARAFAVGGREIVLCRVEGEIYALQGKCTHQELPLDRAEVEDGVLTCEWHGAEFEVCTGAARTLPARRALKTYEARVRNGRVFVVLESRETNR